MLKFLFDPWRKKEKETAFDFFCGRNADSIRGKKPETGVSGCLWREQLVQWVQSMVGLCEW